MFFIREPEMSKKSLTDLNPNKMLEFKYFFQHLKKNIKQEVKIEQNNNNKMEITNKHSNNWLAGI